jgi:hypothetical protein
MKRSALIVTVALCSGTSLLADFSYEQTSKITGGMMAGMMKFAGAFSKQAREPIKTSVMVKGDRMANISANSAQIIDLGKETVTHIDFQKKTYSVLTFAEYSKALEQLNAKMRNEKGDEAGEITVKASVKETGQKRAVAGLDAREVILTIDMQSTDKKTGQTGTFMTMTSDMWVASSVPGYEEVRNFYKRMSQKLNWAPNMGMMAPQGSSKGMAEMVKEMSKLDGVPVYQVVKMGGPVPAGAQGSGDAAAAPQQTQPQEQQATTEKPSAGGALGRLAGGRLGLGGFGRKKKQDDQPQAQAQEQTPAKSSGDSSQAPAGQQGASGALMEMTSELSGFSASAVDASKFDVPAGFKQVESDMLKAGRR